MKFSALVLLSVLTLVSCNSAHVVGGKASDPDENDEYSFDGIWLQQTDDGTTCKTSTTADGNLISRQFVVKIEENQAYNLSKDFLTSDCSGEPEAADWVLDTKLIPIKTEGIPENFYITKVTADADAPVGTLLHLSENKNVMSFSKVEFDIADLGRSWEDLKNTEGALEFIDNYRDHTRVTYIKVTDE